MKYGSVLPLFINQRNTYFNVLLFIMSYKSTSLSVDVFNIGTRYTTSR